MNCIQRRARLDRALEVPGERLGPVAALVVVAIVPAEGPVVLAAAVAVVLRGGAGHLEFRVVEVRQRLAEGDRVRRAVGDVRNADVAHAAFTHGHARLAGDEDTVLFPKRSAVCRSSRFYTRLSRELQ